MTNLLPRASYVAVEGLKFAAKPHTIPRMARGQQLFFDAPDKAWRMRRQPIRKRLRPGVELSRVGDYLVDQSPLRGLVRAELAEYRAARAREGELIGALKDVYGEHQPETSF